MQYIRKYLVAAFFFLTLFSFTAVGQTAEFKKEWTKLFDNVYFRTQTLNDKMPEGQTDFRVFGFKDKREYPAKIEISGNVTDARKENKVYTYTIENAHVTLEQDYDIIKYQGSLVLSVNDAVKDLVSMSLQFLSGNIQTGDVRDKTFTNYHVKPGWHEHVGYVSVNVGKPSKTDPVPPFYIDLSHFMLPKHVTKSVGFTRELSSNLQAGTLPLAKNDSVFIHSVLLPDSRIENVPGLEVVVSEMRMKDDTTRVFDSETLYYKLGDFLGMSDAEVKRNGDDIVINYHGVEPKYRFNATYHFSAFPKFTQVKWEDGSSYANDDLSRSDGSRITQIKFDVKDNILDMPQGYIVNQLKALSDFNNPDFFDFNKYFSDERIGKLSAGGYISPDNKPTLITGGYIQPVRERVEAEREKVRKIVREGQDRYDEAKAWLEARQGQLAADYESYAAGREVFELPNNQASEPHNVKILRKIKKVAGGYEETFLVNDVLGTYPLKFDDDGDACYEADGRTYWFTRIPDAAHNYLDNLRKAARNKAVVDEGRPQMPTFD